MLSMKNRQLATGCIISWPRKRARYMRGTEESIRKRIVLFERREVSSLHIGVKLSPLSIIRVAAGTQKMHLNSGVSMNLTSKGWIASARRYRNMDFGKNGCLFLR